MTDTTDRETHHELVDVLLEIRDRSPEAYNSVKRARRWRFCIGWWRMVMSKLTDEEKEKRMSDNDRDRPNLITAKSTDFGLDTRPLIEVLREDVTDPHQPLYTHPEHLLPIPVFRFKRLHVDAVAPTRAHPTDAGYDLTAFSREYNAEHRYWEYGTGIAVEIPEGFVGLLFPRSSISKTNLTLANSVGVVDASYRGEVKLRFREAYRGDLTFPNLKVGERCGQLVIVPIFTGDMVEADELTETPRGEGGFGSSGV